MIITDHMIGQKKARNLRVVSQCVLAKLNESVLYYFPPRRALLIVGNIIGKR